MASYRCAERVAEAVALIMKRPRTEDDIAELLGVSSSSARAYIEPLRDEGLLYIHHWIKNANGLPTPVYAWQPSVCEKPDAPKQKYIRRSEVPSPWL